MIGGLNPLPLRIGGGPTNASKAYGMIRRAVGEGGSARDDRGIDGLWRRSRAKGLAVASSAVRRALLQAIPQYATDFLPSYERAHGLVPSADATDTERRDAATRERRARLSAVYGTLEDDLKRIDSRFWLYEQNPDLAVTTVPGRAFEAHAGAPEGAAWGGPRPYTEVPAYSTHDVCYVLFNVGYASGLVPADAALKAQAERRLRVLLPSWVSFTILVGTTFIVDVFPVDMIGVSQ